MSRCALHARCTAFADTFGAAETCLPTRWCVRCERGSDDLPRCTHCSSITRCKYASSTARRPLREDDFDARIAMRAVSHFTSTHSLTSALRCAEGRKGDSLRASLRRRFAGRFRCRSVAFGFTEIHYILWSRWRTILPIVQETSAANDRFVGLAARPSMVDRASSASSAARATRVDCCGRSRA
jgi:hypothetical protein